MTKFLTIKEKGEQLFQKMKADPKGKKHCKNPMASLKLVKIVISIGTGSLMKKDNKKNDAISGRLAKITGQKPALKGAKKSIASFKIRQGDPVGLMVTLRGKRMIAFLEKLINIALPRTKDFRGIDSKVLDDMGNLTLGIKEHTIFPETADEDIRDVFGMSITIVSTAHNKKEGLTFFEALGVPFKKK
ncbi:MAG: 50S ribosomal protein L5 [Patescibacteria group bacterium]